VVSADAASRLLATAFGLLVDRTSGEPPARLHPVAAFGHVMHAVEQRVYADDRQPGMAYAATGAAIGALAGSAIGSTAAAVATTSAGRMLRHEARRVGDALERGDLEGARRILPSLVGRDPSALDASGIAAATIESVAENTVDAVVGPVLWAVVFGAPGATTYRAVNTMDAMVGHRSARYEHFGWAAARLDDVASFVPARATALLVCLANPARAAAVLHALRHDAPSHPSPNAGVAEAAFAAALELELGGTVTYGPRIEDRPRLGRGPRPVASDIPRAIRLASRVELVLTALLGTAAFVARKRRRR
jgi:adenosylcobinamide-phosphate synthase